MKGEGGVSPPVVVLPESIDVQQHGDHGVPLVRVHQVLEGGASASVCVHVRGERGRRKGREGTKEGWRGDQGRVERALTWDRNRVAARQGTLR